MGSLFGGIGLHHRHDPWPGAGTASGDIAPCHKTYPVLKDIEYRETGVGRRQANGFVDRLK